MWGRLFFDNSLGTSILLGVCLNSRFSMSSSESWDRVIPDVPSEFPSTLIRSPAWAMSSMQARTLGLWQCSSICLSPFWPQTFLSSRVGLAPASGIFSGRIIFLPFQRSHERMAEIRLETVAPVMLRPISWSMNRRRMGCSSSSSM